jgi:1,2-diacylglycerol 3-alpha-glucosyltransferase
MSLLERRLRVAFVVDTINGRLGGGVTIARNVVERLRDRHDVRVVACDADGPDDIRLAGFQLPFRAMRLMEFVMARPDRRRLEAAFADVDVVHLQFPFWLSFAALRAARRVGRPVVSAFHVQPENMLYNVGIRWNWLNRWLYRQWVNRLYGRTDAVVCPTRFAERKLRDYGLRAPTFVVSNGAPPDLAAGMTGPPVREDQYSGFFVILAAGRFAAEKRQDVLIEAVRRSRHRDRIKLVLAGAGPLEAKLRRKAQALPNGAEIGFLPRPRLANLFATADLFVHCGEVELEGIAVIEAMSMGLPVVVAQSAESAASEFALDEDFRFPAGDGAALAQRIDALIDDPPRLARGRARYLRAAGALNFDASVQSLSDIYYSVLGVSGRPAKTGT